MINVTKSGFTLIEVIIYLALFSIIIGGGMVAAYQVIQSTDASYNHVLLQEEANFLIRKINWAIMEAKYICVLYPGNQAESLQLSSNINCSNLTTFLLQGNNLVMDNQELNSSRIIVSSLLFQRSNYIPNKSDSITANFTLTTHQGGKSATQAFSFTKYLRQ